MATSHFCAYLKERNKRRARNALVKTSIEIRRESSESYQSLIYKIKAGKHNFFIEQCHGLNGFSTGVAAKINNRHETYNNKQVMYTKLFEKYIQPNYKSLPVPKHAIEFLSKFTNKEGHYEDNSWSGKISALKPEKYYSYSFGGVSTYSIKFASEALGIKCPLTQKLFGDKKNIYSDDIKGREVYMSRFSKDTYYTTYYSQKSIVGVYSFPGDNKEAIVLKTTAFERFTEGELRTLSSQCSVVVIKENGELWEAPMPQTPSWDKRTYYNHHINKIVDENNKVSVVMQMKSIYPRGETSRKETPEEIIVCKRTSKEKVLSDFSFI